eukprot:5082240-Amphidinium_carterae.1
MHHTSGIGENDRITPSTSPPPLLHKFYLLFELFQPCSLESILITLRVRGFHNIPFGGYSICPGYQTHQNHPEINAPHTQAM